MKQLLIKVLAPVIKSIRNSPDNLEEYKQEYGYLGPALHSAVIKARTQPTPVTTTTSTTNSSIPCSSTISRTVTPSSAILQQVSYKNNNINEKTLSIRRYDKLHVSQVWEVEIYCKLYYYISKSNDFICSV